MASGQREGISGVVRLSDWVLRGLVGALIFVSFRVGVNGQTNGFRGGTWLSVASSVGALLTIGHGTSPMSRFCMSLASITSKISSLRALRRS